MKYFSILMIGALLTLSGACDDDDDGGQDKDVSLNLVTDGLVSPLVLLESPDNTNRLFIVDQPGQIYIIKNNQRSSTPFLDIQSKLVARQGAQDERGLLGLAFHPDYASNGRFFVFYSGSLREEGPEGWDHTNYVAEYHVSGNANQADVASERIVLAMDHPQPNHNAGMIAFGSDGYLYISVGDGGGGNDSDEGHADDWYEANEGGNGQDITQNLLGSILRIDVAPTEGYAIPADNPFVESDGLDEIFAYGLRNPYRFCFGPDNNMILADAGQELYEEIDVVEKGGNYGWNIKEGAHCFSTANPAVPPDDCPSEDDMGNDLIDPVIEFKNSKSFSDGLGNVSIGGYVYQGDDVSSLDGKYLFGVLTQNGAAMDGAIYAADRSGQTWEYEKISFNNLDNNELNMFVLGFGQDDEGEVYVLTSSGSANSGAVYKIDD